jgi:hypothetical protein
VEWGNKSWQYRNVVFACFAKYNLDMSEQDKSRWPVLGHLSHLRQEYSDEIPSQIIHSSDKNNRFKVRKGWISNVVGDLEVAINQGVVTDPKIIQAANEFIDWATGEEFGKQERTTKADIEKANRMIDQVLGKKR